VIYSNNSSDYFYYKDTPLYRSETESVSFACIANDPNTHATGRNGRAATEYWNIKQGG